MGVLELPLADGPVIVGFAGNAGLCFGTEGSRYIGSGEAPSYRRLPPLGPVTALSWHVPLPVLRGPLSEPSVSDCRRLRTFQARFDLRGYATEGSVSTFTRAGLPLAKARSSAGFRPARLSTSSPWPPRVSTTSS